MTPSYITRRPFYLESHCIVSQGAYLCGATHEYNHPDFRLVSFPMRVGAYAWICARAIVHPRVNIGVGAVLGLGSIATRDLEPFGVYSGIPAAKIKERLRSAVPEPYRHTRDRDALSAGIDSTCHGVLLNE